MSYFSSNKKRKGFTAGQKLEILANQNHRCASCNKPFTKSRRPHFDHIDGDSSNNEIENGQALCPNCHDLKSRDQSRERIKGKKQSNDLGFGNIGFDALLGSSKDKKKKQSDGFNFGNIGF